MYYCYILKCNDGKYYVGATKDLKKRLREHREGKIFSTKNRRALCLAYYEIFDKADNAYKLERSLKNGRTRKSTRERLIQNFSADKLRLFT